jgi:hypothetical protein
MASKDDRYEEPKVVITIPYNSPWAYRGPVKGPIESSRIILGFSMMLSCGVFLIVAASILYAPQQRELYSSEISRCIQKKPCFDEKGFDKRRNASIEKFRNSKQP